MTDIVNHYLKYHNFKVVDHKGKTLTPQMVIYTPTIVYYLTQTQRKKWQLVKRENHSLPEFQNIRNAKLKKLVSKLNVQTVLVSDLDDPRPTIAKVLFTVDNPVTPSYFPIDYQLYR